MNLARMTQLDAVDPPARLGPKVIDLNELSVSPKSDKLVADGIIQDGQTGRLYTAFSENCGAERPSDQPERNPAKRRLYEPKALDALCGKMLPGLPQFTSEPPIKLRPGELCYAEDYQAGRVFIPEDCAMIQSSFGDGMLLCLRTTTEYWQPAYRNIYQQDKPGTDEAWARKAWLREDR